MTKYCHQLSGWSDWFLGDGTSRSDMATLYFWTVVIYYGVLVTYLGSYLGM